MKSVPSQLYYFLRHRPTRRNVFRLLRFLGILTVLITFYSILFHYIMAWEGHSYSWVTGFYWTLTVMSTLGFGDITFQSDLGKVFSSVVLLSGVFLLLTLFPFTFIEFFYVPWKKAQEEARAPSELPSTTRNHIILTTLDPITHSLIKRLEQYHYQYVLLVSDVADALRLSDQGYHLMVGDPDTPLTYEKALAQNALMVVTTTNDRVNTNIAFTVREFTSQVPVIATASSPDSVDILELAGCDHVLQVAELMGQALARRVDGPDQLAHIVGEFNKLVIAESTVRYTDLAGKTLRKSRLREDFGIIVLGFWERGTFSHIRADTLITPEMALVFAGSESGIHKFNNAYSKTSTQTGPVIIIGGGRVGRAAARGLDERGLDYRIVEQLEERNLNPEKYVVGSAAELDVLKQAGIMETSSVIVTTHDDDTNIYLTIYCRRLRPDIQIISRATRERNIPTLQRAGADFVMSYASMGSNAIMNLLDKRSILMVSEGLDVFRVKVPAEIVGRSLADVRIPEETDCTVVALNRGDEMDYDFSPHTPLLSDMELILIGSATAEEKFRKMYG